MKLPRCKRSDLVVLGILLPVAAVAALLTWLVTPPEKTGGFGEQPSTFFNRGYGVKGAYLVLDKLDVRVGRLRRLMTPQRLARYDTLLVLQPGSPITGEESAALTTWIRRGGNLVLAPRRGGRGGGEPWSVGREYDLIALDDEDEDEDWAQAKVSPAATEAPVTERWFDQQDPLFVGITTLVPGTRYRFRRRQTDLEREEAPLARAIWTDESGVIALRMELGRGTIVTLADPYPLSNVGLSKADNGLLLANLAVANSGRRRGGRARGEVGFDEYHHGFAHSDSSHVALTKMVLTDRWLWAVCQALLAGALALFAAGVRFGRPHDVVRRSRRRHSEFAHGAGRLLYDAGADAQVYATLFGDYCAQLRQLARVDARTAPAELAAALATRGIVEATTTLPRDAALIGRQRITREQTLAMAGRMQRMLETLQHES